MARRIDAAKGGYSLKWLECACRTKHVTRNEAAKECVMHVCNTENVC